MAMNLSEYSFPQWVRFVFDHPVTDIKQAWYWQGEWKHEADHSLMLEHSIYLFRSPTFLLDSYSTEQLEQGFWFLLNPYGFLEQGLKDTDVEWMVRKECVISMGDLFEHLFAVNSLDDSACYMWWDLVISGYFETLHTRWHPLIVDDKDVKFQQTIFDTLCRILNLDSRECQKAALHGLGHLNHPLTQEIIETFLNANQTLDAELKEYAIKCIDGEIQ